MKTKSIGFTLIEVMITVAIVAIIASIAYVSYSSSVEKSRRSDGKRAVMQIAGLQEKFALQARGFTDDLSDLGNFPTVGTDVVSDEQFYTITIDQPFACDIADSDLFSCFRIIASARAVQSGDEDCLSLTVDSLGRKRSYDGLAASGNETDNCW